MTDNERKRTQTYEIIMIHMRSLLDKGFLSLQQYREIEEKYREKYKPFYAGLFFGK